MRAPAVAITIWMFIMMMIVGVVGYAYVLWTQYWRTMAEREQFSLLLQSVRLRSNNAQLGLGGNLNLNLDSNYYYSTQGRDNKPYKALKKRKSRNFNGTAAINYHKSKPGTLLLHPIPLSRKRHDKIVADDNLDLPNDKLLSKIAAYRNQLVIQMRKSQLENRNANFDKNRQNVKNHYKVKFTGTRSQVSFLPNDISDAQRNELWCQLKEKASLKMLNRLSEPFRTLGLSEYFPSSSLESTHRFNTCAIVSSAGSMHKSNLGPEIDSHDAVLRFNTAPTIDHERDVGKKTTIRFLNSQVVSKPEFDFFGSQLYRNVTLIVWDPSKYHSSVEEWFRKPEFDLFTPYWLRRKLFPAENFYIVDPDDVWDAWDFLQSNMASPVEHNPPSSGFLGISLMLGLCDSLDVYEYVPSMRLTKRCHYFDIHEDLGCTFGHWHPLSTEKMLSLVMSTSSDIDIFQHGKISFPGFSKIKC